MSVEDQKAPRGEPKPWLLGLILLAVCGVLWLNWWLLQGDKERGTFGDMFGGVNALFSGAAFSVLAFTLLLQRYELKLQREELAETRKVMEAQREQMELQAKTQQLQQFENTFFQLIKAHGDIVQNLSMWDGGSHHLGKASFPRYIGQMKSHYSRLGGETRERIDFALNELYQAHEGELSHYFRHIFQVLKFIDDNREVDRLRYRSFFRAQLSTNEFVLLFYNCLGHRGAACKPLVEKYGMLKHLPPTSLFHVEHANYFHKRAFTPTEGALD